MHIHIHQLPSRHSTRKHTLYHQIAENVSLTDIGYISAESMNNNLKTFITREFSFMWKPSLPLWVILWVELRFGTGKDPLMANQSRSMYIATYWWGENLHHLSVIKPPSTSWIQACLPRQCANMASFPLSPYHMFLAWHVQFIQGIR